MKWQYLGLLVALWVGMGSVRSQNRCENALLENMVVQLAASGMSGFDGGEYIVPSLQIDRPVVVRKNRNGKVNQVGVKLFSRSIMLKHPSLLYGFVERYLLELLLLDDAAILAKTKRERVSLSSDVCASVSTKFGIRQVINRFTENVSICITFGENRYHLSCMEEGKVVLSVKFPVRYELIAGYTQLEAENAFYPSVLMAALDRSVQPLPSDIRRREEDSVWVGSEDYYAVEQMVSNAYYHVAGSDTVAVCERRYLLESVYNLFNAAGCPSVRLEVTQSLYGNKTQTFVCPLDRLLGYMRSQGCHVYTAVQDVRSRVIRGSAIAVNAELGYQHLMLFSLPNDWIEKPDEALVRIKLYTYIPIHNVASLFSDRQLKVR